MSTKIIVGSETRFAAIAQQAKNTTLQLRDEVATLRGELQPLLDSLTELLNVEADLANVNAVAAKLSEIQAVFDKLTEIENVEAKLTEIEDVAGKLAEIQTVFDNLSTIDTVAGIDTEITALGARTTEIDALFTNLSQLLALHAALSQLLAIHANLQALLNVEGDLAEINAVEAKLTEIEGVFNDLQNIDDVAGALVNIGLVAGSIGNVDITAGNIGAVNTTADNIAAIISAGVTNLQAILDAPGAASAAEAFKNDAETARDKAQEWATNPEDVPVETDPDEFSAKHWAAKAAAVVGDVSGVDFLNQNVSVTVGSGKDYATINEAIAALKEAFYPVYVQEGVTATIVLDDDFEMAEQVLVKDTDLGWINITNDSGVNGVNISGITAGTQVVAGVAQEGTVTLDEYNAGETEDKTIFDDLVISLQGGNGEQFYFWNSEGQDPVLAGTGVEVDTDGLVTEDEIAEAYKEEINEQGEFNATRSGRVITITNADEGAAEWDVDGRAVLDVTTEGVTETNFARFAATGHGFDVGDLVAVKDQEGVLEERNYDGLYIIASVDTDWIELELRDETPVLFDADLAGTGTTGRINRIVPITVRRESLTTEFEFFYYPAFGVARGVLPRISCLFEMDTSGSPASIAGTVYQSYIDGLCATDQGKIAVDPFCGFINAHATNLYGTRNSEINANDGIFDRGGRYGIWAYSGTVINARRAYANDCGWVAQALDKPRIDEIDEISGAGIVATRGSIINADKAQANDAYADCVHSEHGATISAPDVIAISSEVGELIGQRYGGVVSITRSYTLDPNFSPTDGTRQPYRDSNRGYLGALEGQAITTPLLRQGISGVQKFYERQTSGRRNGLRPVIADPLYFPPYIISARNKKIIWHPYFYYGERFEEITGGYSHEGPTSIDTSRTNMVTGLNLGAAYTSPRRYNHLYSNKKIDFTDVNTVQIVYDRLRVGANPPLYARIGLIEQRFQLSDNPTTFVANTNVVGGSGDPLTASIDVSSITGSYYIGYTVNVDIRFQLYIREMYGE